MLTFLDGPANPGANGLFVRRAPVYLRVVVDDAGKWDALDQLTDSPRWNETVHVYKQVEYRGIIHVRMAKGKGGCGAMASYAYVDPQPDQAEVRHNSKWRAWVEKQIAKEG